MDNPTRNAMDLLPEEVEVLRSADSAGLTQAEAKARFGQVFTDLWYRGHIAPFGVDGIGDLNGATFHLTPMGKLVLRKYKD